MRRFSDAETDADGGRVRTWAGRAFTDEELSRRFEDGLSASRGAELMDENAARRLIAAERAQLSQKQRPVQQDSPPRAPPASSASIPAQPPPPPPPPPASSEAEKGSFGRIASRSRSRERSRKRSPPRKRRPVSSSSSGDSPRSRSASRSPHRERGRRQASPALAPPRAPREQPSPAAERAGDGGSEGGAGERGSFALVPGIVVRLTGLKAAASLNGELGRLDRFDEASKRWEVRLHEGDAKAIKADNLIPATADDLRAASRPPPPPLSDSPMDTVAPRTPPQQVPPASSSSAGPGIAGLSSGAFVTAPPAMATASKPAKSAPPKTSRRFGTVRWYNGRRRLGAIIPDGGGADLFIPAQGAPNGAQVPPQPAGLFHGTRVSFMPMALKRGDPMSSSGASTDVVCMDVRALAGQAGLTVGVSSHAGAKEENDDRLVATDVNELGFLAGVLDGHRGSRCADYVAKQLPQAVHTAYRTRAKREGSLVKLSHQQEAAIISGALVDAFEALDKSWLIAARKKEMMDGSTGLLALIVHGFEVPLNLVPAERLGCAALWPKPKEPEPPEHQPGTVPRALGGVAKLFVAWAGDCRAVLLRGRVALRVSEDHRPNRSDEQKRIQRAGGMVVKDARGIWRVGPRAENKLMKELHKGKKESDKMKLFLSTSRGFGDAELKAPDPILTATPEVRVIDLVPDDWAILLASDGIFDVLSDQVAADVLWKSMAIQSRDVVKAARDVVQVALRSGSRDNLTAVVMRLGWSQPPSMDSAVKFGAPATSASAESADAVNMFG